jgi:4-hydroxybenzoate polyprenyltransferase
VTNTLRAGLRLLHYWWPLVLGWSLTVVVERASGRPPDPDGLAVLLLGIVAAYSLDRVVDPPVAEKTDVRVRIVLAMAGVACALACATLALRLPVETLVLAPALGAAALFYPRLKQLPTTKTVVLPLVWTWAAIALPFNDGSWLGWRWVLQPVSAPLFLLIASGCVLCDLKDEAADRRAGVRSLPALFGGATTVRVAAGLAMCAAAIACVEHRTGIVVGAAVLGAATAAPAMLATDSTGPLLVDVILTLPGLLISARVV